MRLLEIYFEGLARPVVVEFQGELPEPPREPTDSLEAAEAWVGDLQDHLYRFAGSRRLYAMRTPKVLAIVESTLTKPDEVIWKQGPEDPGVVGPVELETE